MKSRTDARKDIAPEDWLRDLTRLLEERHEVPGARAAELTEEAAQHLATSGRAPEEEFGPVELYALDLAEQEAAPRARWWQRGDVQQVVLSLILVSYLADNLATGGPVWLTVLAAVALAVDLALLAGHLVRRRSAASAGR
ncbi:hypothetical protein [Streptomyces hebeiensis]